MNKILYMIISLPKTIYFNLKYFRLSQAIKLPVFVSYNTKFKTLKGNINIPPNAKYGFIKIGFGDIGVFDKYKRRTYLQITGNIKFNGKANIGHGSSISVSGNLEVGDNFIITAESKIICKKQIKFGKNCLISWDCLFMDTDFHKINTSDVEYINKDKAIIIGNNVWIGCRNLILKGSKISDNSVISANSKINSKFEECNIIISGNPASIIKRNITWEA